MGGDKPAVIAVVGPTAVGKTELAIELAVEFGAEIVSLDSRQMVRGLDVGTAKPTAEQRQRVRHHLLDVVAPDEPVSLAQVMVLVRSAVADILGRGRLPLLVGGTGQYVWAVLEGWTVPPVPPDPALRAKLADYARLHGPEALHQRLKSVDPGAAARIDRRNVRRVIRALEVYERTGRPISELQRRDPPAWATLIIGLTRPRPDLYARIDARVDAMLDAGLEEEVRRLLASGFGFDLPAMSSVGYAQWRDYFAGRIDRQEVARQIRRATRRLVHQQAIWFRADDPRIHWFDLSRQSVAEIRALVARHLAAVAALP